MMSLTQTEERATPAFVGSVWSSVKARFSGNNFLILITIVLFIALYSTGAVMYKDKHFATLNAFFGMLNSNPGLIVIAAGMTMVLISGGIDISVGSQVALYNMMLAFFIMRHDVNPFVMIGIVMVTGVVFGAMQGVLVAYFDIQPFIVTLAGLFLARGLTSIIAADTIGLRHPDFLAMANWKLKFPASWGYVAASGKPQIPYLCLSVLLAFVALIIMFVVMSWTRFGRNVYAVGGSNQSSRLMGLNVKRVKLQVYTLNGLLTAWGGFLCCLQAPDGMPLKATAFEMQCIAAAVIGGALLTGGVGSIVGAFFGVLVQITIIQFVAFNGKLVTGMSMVVLGGVMAIFIVLQGVFVWFQKRRE